MYAARALLIQIHHLIQFPYEAPSIDGYPSPFRKGIGPFPTLISLPPAAFAIPFRNASLASLGNNRFRPFPRLPDWNLLCLMTRICLADSVTKFNERSQALSTIFFRFCFTWLRVIG